MNYDFCKENFGVDYMLIYAIVDQLNERCLLWEIPEFTESRREEICRAIYDLRNSEPVKKISDGVLIEEIGYSAVDLDEVRKLLNQKGFNLPEIQGE